MSWRILLNQAWPDIERLTEDDRLAVTSELMEWVESGPPRVGRRDVGGAQLFQDTLRCGFDVVYLANESVPFASVLRIRRSR